MRDSVSIYFNPNLEHLYGHLCKIHNVALFALHYNFIENFIFENRTASINRAGSTLFSLAHHQIIGRRDQGR